MQLLRGDPVTGRIPAPVTWNAGIINTHSMDFPDQVKKRDALRARPVRRNICVVPGRFVYLFPLNHELCALPVSERISS